MFKIRNILNWLLDLESVQRWKKWQSWRVWRIMTSRRIVLPAETCLNVAIAWQSWWKKMSGQRFLCVKRIFKKCKNAIAKLNKLPSARLALRGVVTTECVKSWQAHTSVAFPHLLSHRQDATNTVLFTSFRWDPPVYRVQAAGLPRVAMTQGGVGQSAGGPAPTLFLSNELSPQNTGLTPLSLIFCNRIVIRHDCKPQFNLPFYWLFCLKDLHGMRVLSLRLAGSAWFGLCFVVVLRFG